MTTANAESLVTDIVAGVVTATAVVALELEAAFVYGSVARGTATPASDIDTFLL
ncbi:MAG: nucleotidyltransferase domain-containing protein, partial [Pseudonocardia sp.]